MRATNIIKKTEERIQKEDAWIPMTKLKLLTTTDEQHKVQNQPEFQQIDNSTLRFKRLEFLKDPRNLTCHYLFEVIKGRLVP